MKDLPQPPKSKKALLISPEVYEVLAEAARREIIPDQNDFISQKRGNKLQFKLRNPPASGGSGAIPPFTVSLGQNAETLAYYVTVTHGVLYERRMLATVDEQALIPHECNNRLDGANPRKFPITAGQGIFVIATETPVGDLTGDDIALAVLDADAKSLTTIPGIQAGIYRYKLAELITVGDGVKLVPVAAGSHIYHESGLTADLRIMDCGLYSDPVQMARLSFTSGRLHSVNQTVEARPLAETQVSINLPDCSSLPTSMP